MRPQVQAYKSEPPCISLHPCHMIQPQVRCTAPSSLQIGPQPCTYTLKQFKTCARMQLCARRCNGQLPQTLRPQVQQPTYEHGLRYLRTYGTRVQQAVFPSHGNHIYGKQQPAFAAWKRMLHFCTHVQHGKRLMQAGKMAQVGKCARRCEWENAVWKRSCNI